MMKRKICVITGTRAEYGLLYWLMKEIEEDAALELQLIVTGMHLSPEFGLTYQEVEAQFKIDRKIEMLLSSDTPVGVSKSMGLAQISLSEAYNELKPDIIVVLGDRYEIFSAVSAAMIARVPVAHLHGGEATEGLIDESIRHSISKMSHLHFVAASDYKRRVVQLGEQPNRVFNVGGLGIDNIKKLNLLSRDDFQASINFQLNKRNLLVTFHPVTLEQNVANEQFQHLLDSLNHLEDTNVIFTKANSDAEGKCINQMIDDYVAMYSHKAVAFTSLGQLRYLSAMQYVDAVVGNSSSGLLEAPSFSIGTIDIGDRQKGRIKAESVISCKSNGAAIQAAFVELYSEEFRVKLQGVQNPYGDGGASKRIVRVLRSFELNNIVKKSFYDVEVEF